MLKAGLATQTEGPGVAGEAAGPRFVPPPVGEIARLFPQLEILRLIGQGGMGAVYKARQPALDRFVALKVLPPATAGDPGFAERFNREARALARLNHPNIVAVHDFGKAGTLHYLVMEFVDGANLREVERLGELTPEQALAIVPQICEALQFAHNEGIVHRDIKPENLLLDKRGRVKITDFGIAKMVGVEAGPRNLTGAKDVMGTPHYMAPEQIEKPLSVDHRADIYSLGVVFYEMLTGELPLGKFQPPSKKVQIDVRLDEVVLHALEKEPDRRYQQASQVKTAVETIAAAEKSSVRNQEREISPRFSRTAIAGAVCLPISLLPIIWFVAYVRQMTQTAAPMTYDTSWLNILFGITGFMGLVLIGPLTTSVLGWIAVRQIHRSTGKLIGLELALFEGLFFPLLMLDAIIAGLWVFLDKLLAVYVRHLGGSMFVNIFDFSIWLLLLALMLIWIDSQIIRRVWCAVKGPLESQNLPSTTGVPRKKSIWPVMAGASLVCVLLVAALFVSRENRPKTLTIRAYIDGSDLFTVSGSELAIQHEEFGLPGKTIYINGQAWNPKWDSDVSSEFTGLKPAFTPRDPQSIRITKYSGRGTVSIEQFPSAANNNTLTVKVSDNDFGGADWYDFRISWDTPPEPGVAKSDYIGQADFPYGDSIEITSVERTPERMTVKGHYSLVSHDQASLALYITTTNRTSVPVGPNERMQISKGRGEFELIDPHLVPGLPHISMYADGHPFASLYFGTREEAQEESKASWITNTSWASAETWSPAPGEQPDLQKILDSARSLTAEGSYADALGRYLWYFQHSRTNDAQQGVRLSFALADWIELGRVYPKARQALVEIRDDDVRQFSRGIGDFKRFMEVNFLSHYLGDDDVTYSLFQQIELHDPPLARRCFGVAEPLLVKHGDYQKCLDYLGDPQVAFERIRDSWQRMKSFEVSQAKRNEQLQKHVQEIARTNSAFAYPLPEPPQPPKFADQNFVGETRQLIEILVATGHKSDAEKIRDEAVVILDDPRLKSAVEDMERKFHESIDSATGLPASQHNVRIDPNTGLPLPAGRTSPAIDPATGLPVSPGQTGTIDSATGLPVRSDDTTQAVTAAENWLTLIDTGNYSESWNEASAIFRGGVTEAGWENSMNTFRKPLGNLVARYLKSAQAMTELPSAPDGHYVLMQFATVFANKKSGTETVTFILQKDGHWKAVGYYIK